jgi:hypothetical protein
MHDLGAVGQASDGCDTHASLLSAFAHERLVKQLARLDHPAGQRPVRARVVSALLLHQDDSPALAYDCCRNEMRRAAHGVLLLPSLATLYCSDLPGFDYVD